jgi:hypothetical protein
LYHDAKNRAMLHSLRLVPGRYPDSATLLQPAFDSATQTHFIAGPLAARQICTELAVYQDFADTQARVLQPLPATVPALQNTCFFAHPDLAN